MPISHPSLPVTGGGDTASVAVAEEQAAVTTVKAGDADGNSITYGISGGADGARFTIHPSTGVLTFITAPDYEAPVDADRDNAYEVKVTASDGSLTDTQILTVKITNITESAAPRITSNGGGDSAFIALDENLTAVTKATATDPNGDTLKFSLSGGADADLFKITSSTGKLSFLVAPNYEKPQDAGSNNVYDVEVMVSDGSLTDTQTISVQILNLLEGTAPKITSNGAAATANISIAESQQAVTTVTATDVDGDAVTYRLATGTDESLFQINTNSGKLAFIKPPDYENPLDLNRDNLYILTVVATDGVFETSQLLFVTVTDAKENAAPKIISDGGTANATVSMAENQQVATIVTATDADNDPITYSISGGADVVLFQISSGGTLGFAAAPDYEKPLDANKDNIYVVTVAASDGSQTASQTLNIVVTDVFENLPPAITSDGGAAVATRKVDENQTLATVVTATDPNGDAVRFSLSGGADAAKFQVDAGNGALTFITAPDYENPQDSNTDNTYEVKVTAADSGGLTATQTLNIQVQDVADVHHVNVSLRAVLQGAYEASSGMMAGSLPANNLMPRMQPYGELKTAFGYATSSNMASPFDYKGKETVSDAVLAASAGDAPVDWVLVEVRGLFDPGKRVGAVAGILQRDGDIVDAVTGSKALQVMNVDDGLYYVMIRHRNHLAVMTEMPLTLDQAGVAAVDFAVPVTKVYGGANARLINGGLALMWSGDNNNSNTVIANGPGSDNSVILGAVLVAPENTRVNTSFRLPGYYATDLNMDGVTAYTGPGNDTNILVGNVLLHPENTTFNGNFILWGKSPIR